MFVLLVAIIEVCGKASFGIEPELYGVAGTELLHIDVNTGASTIVTQLSGEDLALWVTQFGMSAALAAGGTVPEPATEMMLVLGMAAVLTGHRLPRPTILSPRS